MSLLAGFKKIERALSYIEDALLVVILFATMLIAVAQIVLRNVFSSGLSWGDPALKMMVLYLTIVGSMVAARENKHLSIDVLSKFLPENLNYMVQRVTNAFAALICFLMMYYSIDLIKLSLEFNDRTFSDLPVWVLQLIMPIGFGLMAIRFIYNIFSKEIPPDSEFGIPTDLDTLP